MITKQGIYTTVYLPFVGYMRFYNWCIVKNCPKGASEEEQLMFIGDYVNGGHHEFADTKMMYIIWTLEEEENLHYHYYVEFTEKVSMKWIKENFNDNTLHCEPRCGTQKQAIDYVKKIGDYADKFKTKVYEDLPWFELGNKKNQGNRSDLDSMVDMLEEGYMPGDILRMFRGNALRHMGMIYKGIDALYRLSAQDRALDHLTLEDRQNYLNKNA